MNQGVTSAASSPSSVSSPSRRSYDAGTITVPHVLQGNPEGQVEVREGIGNNAPCQGPGAGANPVKPWKYRGYYFGVALRAVGTKKKFSDASCCRHGFY